MGELTLERDVALRIALAARLMPDISVGQLIEVLDDTLGRPLNIEKLARITVTDLKTGLGSLDGEEDGEDIGIGLDPMKNAVRILWGETEDDENLPVPEAYQEGDMPGSIRVAVASNSAANLDGHFGSCLRFLIYQVSATASRLIDTRETAAADLSEDRNAFRADIIKDCQIVYIVSVGGPAAAKIIRAGVYPIKRVDGGLADDVVTELQTVMAKSPPPWLAKILGVSAKQRVKNYQAESEDA